MSFYDRWTWWITLLSPIAPVAKAEPDLLADHSKVQQLHFLLVQNAGPRTDWFSGVIEFSNNSRLGIL